jgi:hypothetical protein
VRCWISELLRSASDGTAPTGRRSSQLAELAGARPQPEELAGCFEVLTGPRPIPADDQLALLAGLNDGLQRHRATALPAPARARIEPNVTLLTQNASIPLLTQLWEARQHLGLGSDPNQGQTLKRSGRIVADRDVALAERGAHLDLLRFGPFASRRGLFELLDFRQPRELQRAAMEQLVQERDPRWRRS